MILPRGEIYMITLHVLYSAHLRAPTSLARTAQLSIPARHLEALRRKLLVRNNSNELDFPLADSDHQLVVVENVSLGHAFLRVLDGGELQLITHTADLAGPAADVGALVDDEPVTLALGGDEAGGPEELGEGVVVDQRTREEGVEGRSVFPVDGGSLAVAAALVDEVSLVVGVGEGLLGSGSNGLFRLGGLPKMDLC